MAGQKREARLRARCPGHPRLKLPSRRKTWMPGTRPGMTAQRPERRTLDASNHIAIDETSARYDGWRIVGVCFLVAAFGWRLRLHGPSAYLAGAPPPHGVPALAIS